MDSQSNSSNPHLDITLSHHITVTQINTSPHGCHPPPQSPNHRPPPHGDPVYLIPSILLQGTRTSGTLTIIYHHHHHQSHQYSFVSIASSLLPISQLMIGVWRKQGHLIISNDWSLGEYLINVASQTELHWQ